MRPDSLLRLRRYIYHLLSYFFLEEDGDGSIRQSWSGCRQMLCGLCGKLSQVTLIIMDQTNRLYRTPNPVRSSFSLIIYAPTADALLSNQAE